ncbi:hypothetical protein T02_13256 [Trichinella nativa]|uniref:Uncharacterized protein n=1 Tax=Trichinella nativa TaxID=6335 RepID=A0A0V1LBR7_9BILA|nr:hypothetical protein T02_13256 [Trichinella nativa]
MHATILCTIDIKDGDAQLKDYYSALCHGRSRAPPYFAVNKTCLFNIAKCNTKFFEASNTVKFQKDTVKALIFLGRLNMFKKKLNLL